MISLEQEYKEHLKALLDSHKIDDFIDNTVNSDLDFHVYIGNTKVAVEVKEKRQPYNMKNWKTTIPQEYLFILDEVTARKCLFSGPKSVVIIRDNSTQTYYVLTLLDLFLMPKERAHRKTHNDSLRGKLLIDLRSCIKCKTIKDTYKEIDRYINIDFTNEQCYGNYNGESISIQGTVRTANQFRHDYSVTR